MSTEEDEDTHMPHVIVKIHPERSEEQKTRLADRIVKDIVATLNSGEESVSVAIEEVKPEDWADVVYNPDIAANWDNLYKKPGYDPFEPRRSVRT